LLKPSAVPPGALVSVISPASTPLPERVTAGMEALHKMGYRPQAAEFALERGPHYFAGTPEMRLGDLHQAFAEEEVRAIFATRGGYGSNYLLDNLDLDLVAESPKPFVGHSDLTALQVFLLDQIHLPSYHGPMLSPDFARQDGVHLPSLRAALAGLPYSVGVSEGMKTLHTGQAKGILYGGCLSILVSLLGTPWEPETQGKLLFLEDVNAKPYQIDRMLWQLRQAGKLEGVTGIIFGEMLDCVSPGAPPDLLQEVLLRVFEDFDGPIAYGLQSGHVSGPNVTLTMGVEAELNLEASPQLNLQGVR
jgi:muramoyltetrapeptide carboxypeptidase